MGSKSIPMFLEINTFGPLDSAEPTSDAKPVMFLAGSEYLCPNRYVRYLLPMAESNVDVLGEYRR